MNDAQQDSVIAVGQRVKQALAGFREIEQIVLFGSVSRGTARAASDIDVALDAGKPLTQGQRVAMIEALALELGRPGVAAARPRRKRVVGGAAVVRERA